MRKLTIETFNVRDDTIEETISFPLGIARSLLSLLPKDCIARFDENGVQLDALLEAALDPETQGIIMEVADQHERIVISVV
ncbi:hypothetical protein BCU70_06095 [Vibrio sp. 10N.286.49.C2]|uniref:hypothetical protein n=1 Tax=unclassified Vibrio TaxID=2614977 RepID=UPI000C82BDF6|nr:MULTISPECIES: hypothetical protein [unclassified Vibrio]PMH31468.1 hypothetical protein BCU70_06095 [Vibrio sp. 10N.286.49.C2]PMH50489.1 hypothetical protein BCU66_18455 [Vibrio sp. 10N.286.49.B1]PMH78029.1 hypothetical protein BCU58_10860 [Vibrio sp. 10N.286.48.B7]